MDPGPRGAASQKTRILIILAVVAIIIVAGLAVLLIRALGGDEPAPATLTQTGAVLFMMPAAGL